MQIKPDDCAARLRETFATGDLVQAVRELVELGLEVIDLVEAHLLEVNEMSLFDDHPEVNINWARRRRATDLAYTLIANIARDEGQEGEGGF